jgi:superfamily II DNA/RNA helicase
VLITSAGAESINLQRANVIVFYDIPFSVGTCIQVMGRILRMDTKFKNQYIIVMYTKDTIDEYKYLNFLDNAMMIKQVVGNDATLPKELKTMDKKNLQTLKDKYLWHYKDMDRKMHNRNMKLLKKNLIATSSEEYKDAMGTYCINLQPVGIEPDSTKRIKALMPKALDYESLIDRGDTFYPIFRSRYIDVLKSPEVKKVLNTVVDSVVNRGSIVVLVDDYGVGQIVKNYILENVNL